MQDCVSDAMHRKDATPECFLILYNVSKKHNIGTIARYILYMILQVLYRWMAEHRTCNRADVPQHSMSQQYVWLDQGTLIPLGVMDRMLL